MICNSPSTFPPSKSAEAAALLLLLQLGGMKLFASGVEQALLSDSALERDWTVGELIIHWARVGETERLDCLVSRQLCLSRD